MIVSPNNPFEHVTPEVDYGRRYEVLWADAKELDGSVGVPYDIYDTTDRLLQELRQYDTQLACESLQGLPTALTVAAAIEEFYGITVDKTAVWSAFILHDVGKRLLPHELNDKSHEGKQWTAEDVEHMDVHPILGYYIALDNGLPQIIARAIAESHGKQRGHAYGINPVLSPQELHVRNCVAIADASDAMLHRTNTKNVGMSPEDRRAYVRDYIRFVCEDYDNNGQALAALIIQRTASQLVPATV